MKDEMSLWVQPRNQNSVISEEAFNMAMTQESITIEDQNQGNIVFFDSRGIIHHKCFLMINFRVLE